MRAIAHIRRVASSNDRLNSIELGAFLTLSVGEPPRRYEPICCNFRKPKDRGPSGSSFYARSSAPTGHSLWTTASTPSKHH